jgi:hypothetical protein
LCSINITAEVMNIVIIFLTYNNNKRIACRISFVFLLDKLF